VPTPLFLENDTMKKPTRRSLDTALEQIIGHLPAEKASERKPEEEGKAGIVSRREERGLPYPGDFPNPASDRTRGCF
jgi:hypothetical protein